jgi:hypothetical protein
MKLNAVGKPYGSGFNPAYRMKHTVSTAHLRFPYARIKFVGEPERSDIWRLHKPRSEPTLAREPKPKRKRKRKPKRTPEEMATAATILEWKQTARKTEFRARAAGGGYYAVAPFFHWWNVDYCKRKSGERRQLGFVYTLDEAKAIAIADADNACLVNGGAL